MTAPLASPALCRCHSLVVIVLVVPICDHDGVGSLLLLDFDGFLELGFLEANPLSSFGEGERVRVALQERDVSWDEAFDLKITCKVRSVPSLRALGRRGRTAGTILERVDSHGHFAPWIRDVYIEGRGTRHMVVQSTRG